ncbi:MAG: glycosyltransferase family 4 protein [Calditrichia bacterium]
MANNEYKNIGFVSTRISGTDGVSLEIEKWAAVLTRNGYSCFYFCGESDRSSDISYIVPEAHFDHPEIKKVNEPLFGVRTRESEISEEISRLKHKLKSELYAFVKKFEIDVLIPENALTIPMNVPLGLAITEFIAETGIPTIAHHHDFYWERERFMINAAMDYLEMAFPPHLPSIKHVVINSPASEQLSHRKGISNTIIPNVYNFAIPPSMDCSHCPEIRRMVGIGENDLFILQPTRVVPRKWIERALEIVSQLNLTNPKLVISHASGDEGDLYYQRIIEYAKNLGVNIVSVDNIIGTQHEVHNLVKKYTIEDIYKCANLVTYPSGYEGFGNAFLETIYYKKPIVVNRYSIFISDIEPKGFDVISFDGFVTSSIIEKIKDVLSNKERQEEMVEKNYQLGLHYFSYETLERLLLSLLDQLYYQWGRNDSL